MGNVSYCQVAPQVMIELLVKCHGIHWAGWYSPENLKRVYEAKNTFPRGYGGAFSIVSEPGYLPGDRRRPSQRVLRDRVYCAHLRETGQA